ncbi:MAG: hypothetical protein HYT30_01595 [Parcubacteria group bacterium]|nr:hypothetical protein [Parcubacteria group bacterium]
MNHILKSGTLIIIVLGLFLGVRYISTTVRYGCAHVPLENVEGGDDCPPPFVGAGKLGWFLTGGSLMPLWNRDATTVDRISWSIEKADRAITSEDDYRFYEQKIAAGVTTFDGTTKRYDLGTAYGCASNTKSELVDGKFMRGTVDCYYALMGTKFAAFSQKDRFYIERYDESAKDGSIQTTTLVEI